MNKQERAVMQQAIDALAGCMGRTSTDGVNRVRAIHALHQALEAKAPEVEPVVFDDWPEFHHSGMGCGLEDRGIHDRYEAMRYGWDEAIERVAERGPFYAAPQPAPALPVSEPVPAGWQIVPVEPTPGMWTAAVDVAPLCVRKMFPDGGYTGQISSFTDEGCAYIYRAMLAAAPKPPAKLKEVLGKTDRWRRQDIHLHEVLSVIAVAG